MSRIFLSHSSDDEREAVALKHWLAQNGWNDVFLDLDPQRGLLAGERWQEALRRAADRCEAVVFIITPAWARSKWCLAEFLLAKSLNKRIFGAILKPVGVSELPTELTSEWQLSSLAGDGPKSVIAFSHRGKPHQIGFLTEGLTGLRIGLEKAGLDARYFAWPPPDDPKRQPYRGLVPLEEKDAPIYFGRDAQIIRGLEALRGMRATGVETLFVILGPSGCGKSSFLRAGLLPRLKRDDRHFLPLEIIRPERQPITGERGLASAIHKARVDLDLAGQTLGAIKAALMQDTGQLSRLLSEIQGAAVARLRATSEDAAPPTLLLSVDQTEELFNPDATDESRRLLALLGTTLCDADAERLLIVAFTIRSDRYEALQTAAELTGLKSEVFDDLKPMPSQQFKEVITGPAHRATSAGNRLEFKPDLVDHLLSDCAFGADTLPLLSLTLSRLYRDYGSDGDLRLDEYRAMGGMGSVVNSEVELVLARDTAEREAQLDHLKAAFIPWLVRINPETDEPMRRLSRYADLPAESRPLIDALAERRLLVIDQRNHEKVVEVAHETLLRQWGELAKWLKAEREDLKLAHALEQAAQDWQSRGRKADWLMEGERLVVAEALAAKPTYRGRLAPVSEFLLASRQRVTERQVEEERRTRLEQEAGNALRQFKSQELDALVSAMRTGNKLQRFGQDRDVPLEKYPATSPLLALQTILDSIHEVAQLRQGQYVIHTARFSPDGKRVVTAATDKTARLWDLEGTHQAECIGHDSSVLSATFSPDGTKVLTASQDGTARLWDLTGIELRVLRGHENWVWNACFSPDGKRILTASRDGTGRLWDLSGKQLREFTEHQGPVVTATFSPDGTKVLTASADNTARLWDLSGKRLSEFIGHHDAVQSAHFSPDGTKVLTASADNTARLWDLSGKHLSEFIGHHDVVNSATFSGHEDRIITTSKDGTARVWDMLGNQLAQLRHQGGVESADCSPIGHRIVTASSDGTARLWELDSHLIELKGHSFGILSASFSKNGQDVVTTSQDGTVRLWKSSGQQLTGLENQGWVRCAIFSPSGQQILTATQSGTVQLWTLANGRLVKPVNLEHQGVARSINFSLDGRQILTGSDDGSACRWDLSGRRLSELKHSGAVLSASFSPDEQRILTASQDGTARLWGLSGNRLRELRHSGAVLSASFSPDGQRILTASQDGTARLWGLSGNQLGELRHPDAVLSASFSPDGQRILTASQDGIGRLWDLAGKQSSELGYPGSALSASFSPDGQRILTTSQDGTARLWDSLGRQLAELGGQGTVLTASFSPDGQHVILTASNERIARLWHIEGLNQLMVRGCKWLKYYFVTHPEERETLCRHTSDVTAAFPPEESEEPKEERNVEDGRCVLPDWPRTELEITASTDTCSDSEATEFPRRFTLTGQWHCDDGGTYFVREAGDRLWWYGEDGYGGEGFSNVFQGQIQGKQVFGHWVDVPRGVGRGAGEMSLEIVSPDTLRAIRKTGNFGGSEWTRSALPV